MFQYRYAYISSKTAAKIQIQYKDLLENISQGYIILYSKQWQKQEIGSFSIRPWLNIISMLP